MGFLKKHLYGTEVVSTKPEEEVSCMAVAKATDQEVEAVINELGSWTLVDGKLHRECAFRDFVQAFGFMAQAALETTHAQTVL
jgi:hypothetical protein